jgi:hypothetical protein
MALAASYIIINISEIIMAKRTYEELVQLRQDGKIGWKQFVLEGDDAEGYRQWCEDHGMEPTDDNAELYVEMTDERMFENQEEL